MFGSSCDIDGPGRRRPQRHVRADPGSFYSSTLRTREDHQLVTRGGYRYIRHPIYFGTLLVTVGVSVFAGSLLGFVVMSLLVPLFLRRITLEEVILQEEFGEQYTSFRQKTKKLVPFAY